MRPSVGSPSRSAITSTAMTCPCCASNSNDRSFEKSLKKPLDWTEIKKNMSPEMKESGKKIVTETINLAGGILSNIINKNIWK